MSDETKPTSQPEPVRGPSSGIQVPDSASERHLREAAEHVKPDTANKRPSGEDGDIAER